MSSLMIQNPTVLLHRGTNRRSSPLSDQNPSDGGECRTVRLHHRMRSLSIRSESAADTNNGMPKLSQNLSFPLLVNGCTGNMGKEVVKAATNVGLRVVPVSFSSREGSDRVVQVDSVDIKIHGPSERDDVLASLVQQHQGLVVVDFTLPTAVNENAELYCKVGVPFVMGTTGGDRERLFRTVHEADAYAVISPQMGKPLVALLAGFEYMAREFPGCLQGFIPQVMESHQTSKKDASGTAKAFIKYLQLMGVEIDEEQISQIRDPMMQMEAVGVPEEYLSAHAFHMYNLTSPDQTVSLEIQHNVCGRSMYAEGSIDAAIFLAKKVQSEADKKLYNMIDVLREGNMR